LISYYDAKLGSYADDGQYAYSGDIAEIIIYNTALNNTDRATVEQYLASKYLIQLAAKDDKKPAPNVFGLSQNYPNPFNPSTVIGYQVPTAGQVRLVVYDRLGREVATLVSESKAAGRYEVAFNAQKLASGLYFYRLQAGQFSETKKMLLVK
jgi:hypothetical protein